MLVGVGDPSYHRPALTPDLLSTPALSPHTRSKAWQLAVDANPTSTRMDLLRCGILVIDLGCELTFIPPCFQVLSLRKNLSQINHQNEFASSQRSSPMVAASSPSPVQYSGRHNITQSRLLFSNFSQYS